MLMLPGLIATLFYRILGQWTVEIWEYDLPIQRKIGSPKPSQIMFLLIGVLFMVKGIDDLIGISPLSAVVIFFGILSTRLTIPVGKKLKSFIERKYHILLPVRGTQLLIFMISVSIVVTGLLDIV